METKTLSNCCTVSEMIENLCRSRELLPYEDWEDRRYRYMVMADNELGAEARDSIAIATAILCETDY